MALTQDRGTNFRKGDRRNDPVAAATKIYAGAIVCLDASGNAVPGSVATTLTARGVAMEQVDNSGGIAGDLTVESQTGEHRFKNDGSVSRVDIGLTAYIVDDETVADNDGTGTRSALGVITDVDSAGVWVDIV
ncbi:MAG TPA: hypothetical protein ENJ64_06680 [Thiotrichales bacterium]|nr:hypothetical protein [Thiotrichales bacterium]